MTKTANYQLNQWEATDKLSRADFNADNAAIDAALAAKAEKSAVSAVENALASKANTSAVTAVETALANYKTSNDAAVASAKAKADAAYSASNPPLSIITVSTSDKVDGDTVYTFEKAPQCVLLQGDYDTSLILQGKTMEMCDDSYPDNMYTVKFKLSGTELILVTRTTASAMSPLTMIAFW